MRAKLIVVQGRATRHEIPIKRFPLTIGRADDCGLTVLHDTVSRHHCELFEQGGRVVVRDRGSTNGTLVDGKPIGEAVLTPGAKLTVGPLVFEVAYEVAATTQSAPSAPSAQFDESLANALLAPDPMLDEMAAGALFDDVANETDEAESDAGTAHLESAQPAGRRPTEAEPGDFALGELESSAFEPSDEPAALDTVAATAVPLDDAPTDEVDLDELAFDVLDDEPLPLPDADDAHSSPPAGWGAAEEAPQRGHADDSPPQSTRPAKNSAAPAADATAPLADRASDELAGLDELEFALEETPLDDAHAPEPLLGAAPASELVDDAPSAGDQLPEPIEAAGFDLLDDALPAVETGVDDAGLDDVPFVEQPRADDSNERPDDTGWIDTQWNALDEKAALDDAAALDESVALADAVALDDAAPPLPADDFQPADEPHVAQPAGDSATPIESLLSDQPAEDELSFLAAEASLGQRDELADLSPLTDDSDSIDLFELTSQQRSEFTRDQPPAEGPATETAAADDSPVDEASGRAVDNAVDQIADDAIDEIPLEPLSPADDLAGDRAPTQPADALDLPLAAEPNVVEPAALTSDAAAESDERADDGGLLDLPVAFDPDADDASDEVTPDVDLDLFTPLDEQAADTAGTIDETAATESLTAVPDEPPLEAFALDDADIDAPAAETPADDVPIAKAPTDVGPSAAFPPADMPSAAAPADQVDEPDDAEPGVAWPALSAADGVMELSPWDDETASAQEPAADEAAQEQPALDELAQTEEPIARDDLDELDAPVALDDTARLEKPVALDEIALADEQPPRDRSAADDTQHEPEFDLDDALDLDFDEPPAEADVPHDDRRDSSPLGQDDEDSLVFDFPPEEMAEDEEAAEAVALEFDELPLEADDSEQQPPALDEAAALEQPELAFDDAAGNQVAADEVSAAAVAPTARRRWWWPFTRSTKPRQSRRGRQRAATQELEIAEPSELAAESDELPLTAAAAADLDLTGVEPSDAELTDVESVEAASVALEPTEAPAADEAPSPAKAPAAPKRRFWSLSLGWPFKRKVKSAAPRTGRATQADERSSGHAAADADTIAPLPTDDLAAESFEPLDFDLDTPAPDAASPMKWSPEASESSSTATPHRHAEQDNGLADQHRAVEPPPVDAGSTGDADELAFDALDDEEPQFDLPSHDAAAAGNGQPAAADDELSELIDFDEPTPSAPAKRRSSGLSEDDLDDLLNSND